MPSPAPAPHAARGFFIGESGCPILCRYVGFGQTVEAASGKGWGTDGSTVEPPLSVRLVGCILMHHDTLSLFGMVEALVIVSIRAATVREWYEQQCRAPSSSAFVSSGSLTTKRPYRSCAIHSIAGLDTLRTAPSRRRLRRPRLTQTSVCLTVTHVGRMTLRTAADQLRPVGASACIGLLCRGQPSSRQSNG